MAKHKEINGVDHKFCGVCQRWLPVSSYHKCSIMSDGLQVNCKDCRREMSRKDAAGNTRRSQASYHRYHKKNLAVRAARRAAMVESDILQDKSFQKRFHKKVLKSDGCWEWQASLNHGGYGQIGFNGGVLYAHRAAWILANGPIPDGLYVCHKCDNRKCCNPEHMFLGTFEDNMNDKVQKERQARPIGEKSPTSKLTWEQVREIRERYKNETITQPVLAKEYGVSVSAISHALTNRTWVDKDYVP